MTYRRGIGMVAGVLIVTACYMLHYYPLSDGAHIFADLTTQQGRFVVIGYSGGPINGWQLFLYCKRPGEYWAEYYLAHDEPYWGDISIYQNEYNIYVVRPGILLTYLDTETMMNHIRGQQLGRIPLCLCTGDPLRAGSEGQQIQIIEGDPKSMAVWPHLKKK